MPRTLTWWLRVQPRLPAPLLTGVACAWLAQGVEVGHLGLSYDKTFEVPAYGSKVGQAGRCRPVADAAHTPPYSMADTSPVSLRTLRGVAGPAAAAAPAHP